MRQNYVTFDFDNFTEKGSLKPLLTALKRAKMDITDITAPNRARRRSGELVKEAIMHFASGQKLALAIKGDGDVFQVKLNNKPIPIKNVDNMTKAVKEMVRIVESEKPAFLKREEAKRKRMAEKAMAAEDGGETLAEARQSTRSKIDSRTAELADIRQQIKAADERIGVLTGEITEAQAELNRLSDENARLIKDNDHLREKMNTGEAV